MRYKFRLVPLLAWAVAIVLVCGLVAVTAFADDLGPPVGTKAPGYRDAASIRPASLARLPTSWARTASSCCSFAPPIGVPSARRS